MTHEELEARITQQGETIAAIHQRNAETDAENALVIKMTKREGIVATFRWRQTKGTMPASHQIAIWNSPAMKWSWRTI